MGDIPEGLSPSSYLSSSCSSSLSNHNGLLIDSELRLMAEQRVRKILYTVQPDVVSDKKRKDVIEYIQMLISNYYGTEIIELFPFGSFPFKTYLPDGDIDLTAITHPNTEKDLAKNVCSILEAEIPDPAFKITNVQYVCAQVKVIKFSVNNIAVDISFNQRAAICSLFFLEQVNQLIGKEHLFKRSIIMIKAWCFYESRILGAHYGLISTYALETLVMHVINLFHSSLHSPLEVLYRFLDYYSTFDWDNYCVSVYGPVALSYLPDIVVNPENGDKLLFSREVLKNCRETFSDSVKALETSCEFRVKHLNILDPLKEDNNLGRSVSKGNFHRIKSAILFGARQLQEIFQLPGEMMGLELEKFFVTSLNLNGKRLRPDSVPVAVFATGRCEEFDLRGDYNNYFTVPLLDHWCPDHYASLVPKQSKSSSLTSPVRSNSCALDSMVPCRNNTTYTCGTDAFFWGLPVYHVYAPQLFASGPSSNIMESSRGTGTYIPDMNHLAYRERQAPVRIRNHETRIRGQLQGPGPLQIGGQVEKSREQVEGENSLCPDLSMNEFPSLSAIYGSTSSDLRRSCQSSVNNVEPTEGENSLCPDLSTNEFPSLSEIFGSISADVQRSCQSSVNNVEPTEGENSLCPDLSTNEFPSLSEIFGSISADVQRSCQSSVNYVEPAEGENSLCPDLSTSEFPSLSEIYGSRSSDVQRSCRSSVNYVEPAEGENSLCPDLSTNEFPSLSEIYGSRSSDVQRSCRGSVSHVEPAEGENSLRPDLSMNEFPSLSAIYRSTSSDVRRSCQSSVNYPRAEDHSIPFQSTDFQSINFWTSRLPSDILSSKGR